jgi:multidrug resistance efflux pump
MQKIYLRLKGWLKQYLRVTALICIAFLLVISLFYSKIVPNLQKLEKRSRLDIVTKVNTFTIGTSDLYMKSIAVSENQNKAVVVTRVDGFINEISISLGDKVEKNDPLVTITDTHEKDNFFEQEIIIVEKEIEILKEELSNLKRIERIQTDIAKDQTQNFEEIVDIKYDSISNMQNQIAIISTIIEDIENNLKTTSNTEEKIELIKYKDEMQNILTNLKLLEYQSSSKSPELQILENKEDAVKAEYRYKINLVELNLALHKAKLKLIEMQKSLRTLTAPISGRVEKIYIYEKNYVKEEEDILLINGEMDMTLNAFLSVHIARQIDIDKKAFVEFEGIDYEAHILFVSDIPVQNNLYEIKLKPEKNFEQIFPIGSSVEVKLPLKNNTSATTKLFVPVDSIHSHKDYKFVHLIENHQAVQRQVQVGQIIGGQIEILEGLIEGDVLITDRNVYTEQKVSPKIDIFLIDELFNSNTSQQTSIDESEDPDTQSTDEIEN